MINWSYFPRSAKPTDMLLNTAPGALHTLGRHRMVAYAPPWIETESSFTNASFPSATLSALICFISTCGDNHSSVPAITKQVRPNQPPVSPCQLYITPPSNVSWLQNPPLLLEALRTG
jgi:hypothetical protein